LFGRNKAAAAAGGGQGPSPGDAIRKLKEAEEMLQKRCDFQQTKIDKEMAMIKEKLKKKDKKGAMSHLQKKKLYEKAIDTLDRQMGNIRVQIETLETATMNKELFDVQKTAFVDAMKKVHAGMDVDKVEEINMDMQEQLEMANEIQEALAAKLPGGYDLDDEDELDAELEGLEQEMMDEELVSVEDIGSSLPSVPSAAPHLKHDAALSEEDDELARLAAEMS